MNNQTKYLSEKEMQEILSNFSLEKAELIADGKSKALFKTSREDVCLMEFKPSLRSITYDRKQNISGTEIERMKACLEIYLYLEENDVRTQLLFPKIIILLGQEGDTKRYFLAIKPAKQYPIEWISRYYAAGSIVKLFPSLVKKGQKFNKPLHKYDLKQDIRVAGVDDPMLNESYIVGLDLMTKVELSKCQEMLTEISELLNKRLTEKKATLIDMKMEFGKDSQGRIMLTDEISQDCMRVNNKDGNSITKDTFREWKSEEDVLNAYKKFTEVIGFREERIRKNETT